MDGLNLIAKDGPVVEIHKGWRPSKKDRLPSSQLPPDIKPKQYLPPPSVSSKVVKPPVGRRYQFINTTKPNQTRDVEIRSLVRKHARNQRSSFTPVNKPTSLGYGTALGISEYPIEMQPHMHQLLSTYLAYAPIRMFSLEKYLKFNPLRSPEWFRFAVADAAMLHTLLYAAATYIALLNGTTESRDMIYHQTQAMNILQKRLASPSELMGDSTVGAISCLALGEAVMGSQERWHVHMKALKHIIAARGGFSSLPRLMYVKLRRTDVTGAIDYGATPYLHIQRSALPPVWSILPPHKKESTQVAMTKLLTSCRISQRIISIMIDLSLFSQTIRLVQLRPKITLDPEAFSEDLYDIEFKFLSFPKTLAAGVEENPMEKAYRIGGLLFVKSILEEFPHSITGPVILLAQLREALNRVSIWESGTPFLMWLGMLGAILAKDGMRNWYISFSVIVLEFAEPGMAGDDTMRLNELLDLRSVFGKEVERFWRDVGLRRTINSGLTYG